ncbi:MAG: L,D-transpeptidase [Anaerolineae bacterium]|nr:L,D-transpeptidase [Anaerolineae bacterium]
MKRLVMSMVALAALSVMAVPAVAQNSAAPIFEPSICAYAPNQPTSDACLEMMGSQPKPQLDRAPLDGYTISTYSFWKVGPDAVNKFDGPNGNVIGVIAAGFNFVNVINADNPEWLQIQGGEWIQKSTAQYVETSRFSGVLLPDGWNQPFAWVLDTTGIYSSLTPGGPSTAESGYLTKRYDMVNIYAEAYDSEGWRWYMIGPNQWIKQTFVAKVQPAPHPTDESGEPISGRWVAVDLYEQTLVAYEGDKPVFATLIASGLDGTETNEGLFTVWARLAHDPMSGATGAPNAYALQTVPWVMYFDGSISLHGTYWHNLFGYRRSRGCVNLSISDAKWVYNWMEAAERDAENNLTNHVYVFSSGVYGQPPQQVAQTNSVG